MSLKIKSSVYCVSDLDIIEFFVSGIRKYEDKTFYELISKSSVGRHHQISVIIFKDNKKYRFVELIDLDDDLDMFINGYYYDNFNEAKLAYHELQLTLSKASRDRYKQLYNDSTISCERLEKTIKYLREII